MLARARQELESGPLLAQRFQVDAAGIVQQQRCELQLLGERLHIRSNKCTGVDLGACCVVHARLGTASTCTELLHQSGQTHLPPVTDPWRCFHFAVLEQVGGPSTGDVTVCAEPYYCASETSHQARTAVLALTALELAARDGSCGRYNLLHKAAATHELLTMNAAQTNAILPRGSQLLVHEICGTPNDRPRARTSFGWVSVISQGGRTMLEPVVDSEVAAALRTRPGMLLCDTAKLRVEAMVPAGPFHRHGVRRVIASLLRQVARGVALHDGKRAVRKDRLQMPPTQRSWDELSSAEQAAAQTLGWSYSSWRCGRKLVWDWASLSEPERCAAAVLQFDETGWNKLRAQQMSRAAQRKEVKACRIRWLALDDVERDSALWLGWSGSSWDQGSCPPVCRLAWTELSRDEREAASTLGWSPTTWHEDIARHDQSTPGRTVAAAGLEVGPGDYWLHVDRASVRVNALDPRCFDALAFSTGSTMFCRVWLNGKIVGETRSVAAIPSAPIRVPRANQDELREQLSQLGLKDMRQRAIRAGVSHDALEDALDQEDPREATLVITLETMLREPAPQTSAAGDLGPTGCVDAELNWGERIQLVDIGNPVPVLTTLRVELHSRCQKIELHCSEEVAHADESTINCVSDTEISPPSREQLEVQLNQLARRDTRLASSFSSSPYKGVSSSIGRSTDSSLTPLQQTWSHINSKEQIGPEPQPPTDMSDGSSDSSLLGVVILRSQGPDGFPGAASYALHPTKASALPVSVNGTVRIWVSSLEGSDRGNIVGHECKVDEEPLLIPQKQVWKPPEKHSIHMRLSHDCVSWAALTVHEQPTIHDSCDGHGDNGLSNNTSIDAMASNFGASSVNLQGVPLIVVDPFLADTDPLLNSSALRGAIVLCGRGNVPFVEKAKRLQLCEAAAVVFVNTEDQPFCPMSSGNAQPGADEGVMIPAVCIQKTVGQNLVDRVWAAAEGRRPTASLILGQNGTQEQGVTSATSSLPLQTRSKASIATEACTREITCALETPANTSAGAMATMAVRGSTQATVSPPTHSVDSGLPVWVERHDLRIEAFAQLQPVMQLFVAKHAVPRAGSACPSGPTLRQADVRKMAADLLPHCDQDRVVAACRLRCIDRASTAVIPYPRRSGIANNEDQSLESPASRLNCIEPTTSIRACSISEPRNRAVRYDIDDASMRRSPSISSSAHQGADRRHLGEDDELSVDMVVAVFLSPAYMPSTRVEWNHLCEMLRQWRQCVVRRCEVVKATLVFKDMDGGGTHMGAISVGEQVEVLESSLNARGNVVSLVRRGETHEQGWVTAVKKNGAVLLISVQQLHLTDRRRHDRR